MRVHLYLLHFFYIVLHFDEQITRWRKKPTKAKKEKESLSQKMESWGTASDFVLWFPEQSSLDKTKPLKPYSTAVYIKDTYETFLTHNVTFYSWKMNISIVDNN